MLKDRYTASGISTAYIRLSSGDFDANRSYMYYSIMQSRYLCLDGTPKYPRAAPAPAAPSASPELIDDKEEDELYLT